MSIPPESIASLSPEERRALLARLLQEKANGRKTFPLSFAQARLWILDRLVPGDPTYNVPLAMRLPGPLDVAALEQALQEVVRRHEALRTTFALEGGRPVQVVAPSLELKLNVIDLGPTPPAEREAEAARLVFEESAHAFDLASGPLIRARLLRLTAADHFLVVVMHHIVSDGWSLKVFHHELSTLYLAFLRGQPSPLAELPVQYADFAQWQARMLSGEVLERHLSYWRKQLAGIPAVIDLPTDRPRPPIQSHRGALHAFALEPSLYNDLRALGRREGVTPFMVLLAAFKALLWRHAGQGQVVVGTPIANRTRVELEGLIGFFVNTLVLRTDLSGDPTFRALLGRVREVTLGAYAHQDMPFERLVEELQPERDLSHNPLFQVMFTLQNMSPTGRSAGAAADASPAVDATPVVNGTAKFDISLALAEVGQGLQGVWEYNTDLFDAATIAGMAERYRVLLRGAVSNPDLRVSRLPLLRWSESSDLLAGWSGPEADGSRGQSVCESIAAHARAAPEAVAVSSDAADRSYLDLDRRANQLARRLRALGVGPGAPVAVFVEQPADAVVAALGILKAGGVYVPLDPAEPTARLALMLEDAGASLVVSEERLGGRLPQGDARAFYLDRSREELARESGEGPNADVGADDLACLLYESSPAGRPQAVMVSHRALSRDVFGGELRLTTADRVVYYPSAFGHGALFHAFGALAAGARVVCVASRPPAPPRKLAGLLRDQGVTVLSAPGAMLERVAREFPWALKTLRLILCDDRVDTRKRLGEVLAADVLERVYACSGATEVGGCYALRPLAEQDGAGVEAVGRPAASTKIYLLDSNQGPVPHGVLGELYVGAEALALGYHKQPARTAEAFVLDPHSATPGARLYRTGELARSVSAGGLKFVRRGDGRFVTRGGCVAPEEIEAAALQHAGVGEVAVVLADAADVPGAREVSITAFVVAADGQTPPALEDLRGFLRERLPEAMLPTSLTLRETLPRTPSGEVDRGAVARLADAGRGSTAAPPYVAPRNDIEERMAGIWAETFGVERVGVHDNFFRLGGHSLLATQVVARASDLFGVDLPLNRLFEMPTIAELSGVVGQLLQSGMNVKPPPITRMSREAVRLPGAPGARG